MSKIVEFYTGGGDHKGRTLEQILKFSDSGLESSHDVIQWIFPLHERSFHSTTAPVLTPQDIKEIRGSKDAVSNLRKALDRFSSFLGVGKFADDKKQRFWCNTGNHNLLRVTRVIRCLRLMGLDKEAQQFHADVTAIAKKRMVSPVTLGFWDRALNEPVDASMTGHFLNLRKINVK